VKKPPQPEESKLSFWSTLPGIITAIGGTATALAAAATTIYPMVQPWLLGTGVIQLKDFSKRIVLEGGAYTVETPTGLVSLIIDDIKVVRRMVFLRIGPKGEAGRAVELRPEAEQAIVIGTREYSLRVHDFADVAFGADTALITIALK